MGVHQPLNVLESIVAEIEYPMLVATTTSKGQNCGCLVGFATPCSMDPFRYIAFISRKNRTFDVAHDADVLALHFLSADEESLASILGKLTGDAVDKFALCDWQKGPDGVPILADAQRWIAGPIVERMTGGDHHGFVVEPQHASTRPWVGQFGSQAARRLEVGHGA